MKQDRQIRILHTVVAAQFAVSAALIIFWTLYEAHLQWWAIFSISAQAVVIVVFGILIYGFALFRRTVGERIEAEHPLSGSVYYRFFYVVMPIFGGLASGIDYLTSEGLLPGLRGWALGTVLTAFVVWLFVDTAVGIGESILPETRRLRAVRLAGERELREAARREKELFLERLRAEKRATLERLRPVLDDRAQELMGLLAASADDPSVGSDRAVTIGLEVWQAGGVDCMNELFAAIDRLCAAGAKPQFTCILDYWWDGVGDWRRSRTSRAACA